MAKRKNSRKKHEEMLDSFSEEHKKPGRPARVRPSEVYGRALNYRGTFGLIWDKLREPLLKANSEAEIVQALETGASGYAREFIPLAGLVLRTVHHQKFPKRREPQVKFLADSLAAYGRVTAKRSREIVAEELKKEREKQEHRVIRREFYIVCSCGYQGPTYMKKCPGRHHGQSKLKTSDVYPLRLF